ncbi:MAG: hypothetical protein RR771_08340, partial [Acinetobacter sp.]
TLDKKGRYTKNSIYATVMQQLEYWQAIEDGEMSEEDEPKKKKKQRKTKKEVADTKAIEENTAQAKTLKSLTKKHKR